MGRPKSYDREVILEKAMHLFWDRGYHSVSTRDLVDAMDINVYSLYAEFGSKEGLFEAAIKHYGEHMVPFYIGALEQPDASIATIREVLHSFPAFADSDGFVPGCLITNSATELAPTQQQSQDSIARYVDRLTAAFINALTPDEPSSATVSGARSPHVVALARFLTTTTLGLFVMIRAQTARPILQDAVDNALTHLTTQTTSPK